MNSISAATFVFLAVAVALPGNAAEFTVTPVRIFMTPRDRAVAVTVTNDGGEEIVMQADLYDWKQAPDGTDELVLTEDMILSPPILKVPPKSRQVVRLARLVPPSLDVEQTYRLIVREIPEARPQKDLSLQLALAFSLPVFITPPGAKRSLNCELERGGPDLVKALCKNSGRAYAQLRSLELFSSAGEKIATRENGGYILPAVRRAFEIKRSAGTIAGGKVKLQVGLDDGTVQTFEGNLPE
jgi:fimbrial chaperone protein